MIFFVDKNWRFWGGFWREINNKFGSTNIIETDEIAGDTLIDLLSAQYKIKVFPDSIPLPLPSVNLIPVSGLV